MKPSLVAIEQRERTVGAGDCVERHGDAVMFGDAIEIFTEALLLILHALFQESRFDARVARDPPMGGGELMDEIGFGLGLRAEVIQVVAELDLVFVGGLIVEDDGAGGESVGEGVEGGRVLAGGSGGSSGFDAVGAGGGDFAGGRRHRVSRSQSSRVAVC